MATSHQFKDEIGKHDWPYYLLIIIFLLHIIPPRIIYKNIQLIAEGDALFAFAELSASKQWMHIEEIVFFSRFLIVLWIKV
jgi:hypothetical protein